MFPGGLKRNTGQSWVKVGRSKVEIGFGPRFHQLLQLRISVLNVNLLPCSSCFLWF